MFAMRLLNAAAGQSYCENFHRTMGPSINDVAMFGTQCTANICMEFALFKAKLYKL
jgi:hypothetical protein